MTMDDLLERFDEAGNSFFLRLENLSKGEILAAVVVLLAYGKMKSGR